MRSSLLKDREQCSLRGSHAMAAPDYASLSIWKGDLGSHQQHKFHMIFFWRASTKLLRGLPLASWVSLSVSLLCGWLYPPAAVASLLWKAVHFAYTPPPRFTFPQGPPGRFATLLLGFLPHFSPLSVTVQASSLSPLGYMMALAPI